MLGQELLPVNYIPAQRVNSNTCGTDPFQSLLYLRVIAFQFQDYPSHIPGSADVGHNLELLTQFVNHRLSTLLFGPFKHFFKGSHAGFYRERIYHFLHGFNGFQTVASDVNNR